MKTHFRNASDRPFDEATAEDLYYCYRVVLDREPDEVGWSGWLGLIEQRKIGLSALTDAFLHSQEARCKRGLGPELELIELGEFKIWIRPRSLVVGRSVALERQYEPHVTRALRPLLTPGTVFLDIGANIGYFTLLAAARVGPTGRVIALEPGRRYLELLVRNIQENRFTNVELHPYAVADRTGIIDIGVNGGDGTPAAFLVKHTMVAAVALDELLADVERIDVVKIDIDGGEPMALRGMQNLLRRHRPVFFTEFCPELLSRIGQTEPSAYLEQVVGLGYDLYLLDQTTGKSPAPLTIPAVLDAVEQAVGCDHIDLVAIPR